jgi:hypothetical protein
MARLSEGTSSNRPHREDGPPGTGGGGDQSLHSEKVRRTGPADGGGGRTPLTQRGGAAPVREDRCPGEKISG